MFTSMNQNSTLKSSNSVQDLACVFTPFSILSDYHIVSSYSAYLGNRSDLWSPLVLSEYCPDSSQSLFSPSYHGDKDLDHYII